MNLEQSSKKYHANHFIVYNCQYHVILCPKYRRKVFYPPLDTRLQELIRERPMAIVCSGWQLCRITSIFLMSTCTSASPSLWDRLKGIRLIPCGKRSPG